MVSLLDDGVVVLAASLETYALVAAATGGTLLQQSAFQAGDLAASLPAVTVGEPVVGVAIGLTVLGEQLRADGLEWAIIGVSVAVTVAATVALARSAARSAPAVASGAPAG